VSFLRQHWKKFAFAAGSMLVLGLGFCLWLPGNGMAAAKNFIRWKFDDVHHITPAELSSWLEDANRTSPMLLDIRMEKEFAVSHLPNARRVSPNVESEALKPYLNEPVVVYCAVGYRSAQMARRLQALGHTNVFNLEGAIFAWAAEGLPLEGGDKVHPYNAMGRRMLADELEAR